jgi:hypothetical protein
MSSNVVSQVIYPEYCCSRNSPLNCDRLQQTLQEYKGARFCMDCGFPVMLAPGQTIEGRRGSYQLKKYLGARGWGRLYAGIQLGHNRPVVIKEYLLPENCFNDEEAQQRKTAFTQVAGLTPADGRVQDFRVVPIIEAIADVRDVRCYLITEDIASVTLKQYLSEQGAMNAAQVKVVLHQVLQTLQFLHSQKLRRPSGQIEKGIVHANLNLESLLLAGSDSKFQMYLCDLADWEMLFQSMVTPSVKHQPSDDLIALGYVAFYLWNGGTIDSSGQPLDPRASHWASDEPQLKQFILQLMGIEQPFESAEAARVALGQVSTPEPLYQARSVVTDVSDQPMFKRWLLFGLLAVLTSAGLWFLLRSRLTPQPQLAGYQQLPLKKLTDVSGIEPGEFKYVSEQDGTWSFVLKQPIRNGTLGDILYRPKLGVEANFNLQGLQSTDHPHQMPNPSVLISQLQQGKADFAITSLGDELPHDLEKVQIAYDGLLVYVPFNKGTTLSKALKGQISLENLRQIYTGEITNWQELGGPDLKIVPQMPTEPEAVQLFQELVLQDDAAIAQFQKVVPSPQPTRITQEQGRSEFTAKRSGIISFGILSKTWNQCSGYPLALKTHGHPVQALERANNKPVTPDVNLCDKANDLNVSLFQSDQYPLGYPLFVVYLKDNRQSAGRKFSEMLLSQEGQCLLSQVGLVPLQPVPNHCSDLFSQNIPVIPK